MTGDGGSGNGADLRAENARLIALLVSHGIEWRKPAEVDVPPAASALSTDQKVMLFRRLFAGRTDVYPVRWESKAGKTGYGPACANEWRAGVCEKPRIKCADCGRRSLIALTDRTIFDHLAGRHTTGVYPLLTNDTCNLLAVDFDGAEWREGNPSEKQDSSSNPVRDFWGTQMLRTGRNSLESVGTDGNKSINQQLRWDLATEPRGGGFDSCQPHQF